MTYTDKGFRAVLLCYPPSTTSKYIYLLGEARKAPLEATKLTWFGITAMLGRVEPRGSFIVEHLGQGILLLFRDTDTLLITRAKRDSTATLHSHDFGNHNIEVSVWGLDQFEKNTNIYFKTIYFKNRN